MATLSNSKHERFAQEIAQGRSFSDAYVAAGFKANRGNAARLNANESIRGRVEELQKEAAEKAGASVEFVVEGLMENFHRSMQAVEVKDNKGIGTGEYRYEGAVANRSLELIGKHLGMFKERVEHSGPNGAPVRFTFKLDRPARDTGV